MASWMLRCRSNRSTRYNRSVQKEDFVKLDFTKDPYENAKEILLEISKPSGLSDVKHLNYLNAFVKLILHVNKDISHLGYCTEEILCCLRVSAVHEATQIRSGAFRAIRYLLISADDIITFNKLLYPYLVVRSMDLLNKNDVERIEAMKLTRKILLISAFNFDKSMARSLVSLANGGYEDKDRMLRVCLASLSEIGVLNHELFIMTGGVAALTRNLLECQTPRIAESLCGVLLMLLDKPITRYQAAVDLHCVAAPYCDFHYRHGWLDKNRDERELRFNCSRLALLSIFRSWPGILHFCSPNNTSGLKAIVDVLYLDQLEVRKAVLDLLYDLLGLPQPEWTDELSVALAAIDPAEPQATWRLNEGFVAAEGRSILPHLSRTTPNIADQHLSLLLYCFIDSGLIGALCEVIATSDTFISVRATVLLGELLRLIQILLPPECCNITPALPNLLEYAVYNVPQALHAITALQQLHKLLKRRPASYSLYLDYILQSGTFIKSTSRVERLRKHKSSKTKLVHLVHKEGDDEIKETCVLLNKDYYMWNWNQIKLILMGEADINFDMSDTTQRSFFKRLIEFYLPSNNKYSHMDLTTPKNSQGYTIVGLQLLECLMKIGDAFSIKLLLELFTDISTQIEAITNGKSAHDCLFSPQHMTNTQCQTYFLFIGRFGTNHSGIDMLNNISIYDQLKYLATTTNHDCYVKLIISSLDYKNAGPARDLLAAVLTCSNENSRLYATQFLLILLRAGLPQFSMWGIKLLTKQLYDSSRPVYLFALSTLHEASEIPSCLETLVKLNPDVLHLGEKGILLLIRFLSIPSGYKMLNKNNFIINEIRRWDEYFNYKYVKLIEGEISDALTLHQRGEDGRYDKRTSSTKNVARKDLFLPPHLYGQLSKHEDGLSYLIEYGSIDKLIQIISLGICESDEEILFLKAALWALGHFGSTNIGLQQLQSRNVLGFIVTLVENSAVFSIRSTAYYALGLLATTKMGADCLFKLGWVCTRHDRHDRWPIIEEENWDGLKLVENNFCVSTGSDSERNSTDPPIQGDFYIPDADSSTTDEDIIFAGDNTLTPNQRSLTLPTGQTPYSAHHQRSLSESKTFDILKNYEQRQRLSAEMSLRHRDNSITESTTSGVSSCDSMFGKNIMTSDKPQTLSPIPSSSSLITIKKSGVKLRRYSESTRRVTIDQSLTPSDRSTVSPSGSGRLSHQDLIGYATMRSLQLRRRTRSTTDDKIDPIKNPFMRVNSLDRRFRRVYSYIDQDTGAYGNYLFGGLSLSSLSSVQKFSIKDNTKEKERCYMGICLPVMLCNIFPDNVASSRRISFYDNKYSEGSIHASNLPFNSNDSVTTQSKEVFPHDKNMCLNCSTEVIDELEDNPVNCLDQNKATTSNSNVTLRFSILKEIERLSNPVIMKQAKQILLHYKQTHPHIFQDVCLYSDVCKMVSENSFRLGPRRFIQDIFMEVNFNIFYMKNSEILLDERKTIRIITAEGRKSPTAAVQSHLLSTMGMDERKEELLANKGGVPYQSNPNVIRGFKVKYSNVEEKSDECLSPTKFETRSPPLTSVKEENTASVENLHMVNKSDANNRCTNNVNVTQHLPLKTTLDSLNLTCNENKFPIKKRTDPKITYI